MSYFVYILISEVDQSFYIGSTSNLGARLHRHNFGFTRYTATKRPWKLAYSETFHDKSTALRRERFLKRQRNRTFYEALINQSKNNN